jgi:hypothetical protein
MAQLVAAVGGVKTGAWSLLPSLDRGLALDSRRPGHLLVSAALVASLLFLLLVALLQGPVAGGGILAFYLVLTVLVFAIYIGASLPLFLALTLVLILDLGVLMDSGFLAIVAVPLVACMAVAVVLFHAITPGKRRRLDHLVMGPRRLRAVAPVDYFALRPLQ